MTPALSAVYDELLERAARPPFEAIASQHRARFVRDTGSFDPEHPAHERRIAAAWEDALVRGGLAETIAATLEDPGERELAIVLGRAQRGIFRIETAGARHAARDLHHGGAFLLLPRDEVGRAASYDESSVFLGRIVAGTDGCAVLPGLVWLPPECTPFLDEILAAARERAMSIDALTAALLRMDHAFRTLSRVRPSYVFRPAALDANPREAQT